MKKVKVQINNDTKTSHNQEINLKAAHKKFKIRIPHNSRTAHPLARGAEARSALPETSANIIFGRHLKIILKPVVFIK